MSHDAESHAEQAGTQRGGGRSYAKPIKGVLRLFGPSLLVGFVAPFIFPGVRRAARPVVEGLIKGGLILGESVKEAADDAREQLGDLLAKVKADRAREAEEAATAKRES